MNTERERKNGDDDRAGFETDECGGDGGNASPARVFDFNDRPFVGMKDRSRSHPRQCHLCRYNGVNALLAGRGLPLCREAADACMACEAVKIESCHRGASIVSLDSSADAWKAVKRADPAWHPPGKSRDEIVETPLADVERQHLLALIQAFAALEWDDAGLVAAMLRGETIAQIARARKVSEQSIHSRWQKLINRASCWRSIANGLIGSGVGRKPKQKNTTQKELFI